ncbi:hypothetical protein LguiA_019907 [Lonicera macranthoides]
MKIELNLKNYFAKPFIVVYMNVYQFKALLVQMIQTINLIILSLEKIQCSSAVCPMQ